MTADASAMMGMFGRKENEKQNLRLLFGSKENEKQNLRLLFGSILRI
jgi:hypothetical protein